MKTAFHGLGQCLATFETDAAASDRGKVCKMAGGGKIAVAATAGEGCSCAATLRLPTRARLRRAAGPSSPRTARAASRRRRAATNFSS